MLVPAVLIAICWGATTASYYPPECPVQCECEGPTMTCDAGVIPALDHLDKRLTRFKLQDAKHQIKTLTNNITKKLDQLVSLQLISVGLQSIENGALAKITRLEDLEISHNNIETLSADNFEGCNQLAFLNLESNGIKVIENNTFSSLSALKKLNLYNNSIMTLPQTLPRSIQDLNLEKNQIEAIEGLVFGEMTSLNLCNNKFTKIDPEQVKMYKLKDLCLGGSEFMLDPTMISAEKFPILGNLRLAGTDNRDLSINGMALKNILSMASQSLNNLTLESCMLPNLEILNLPNNTLKSLNIVNVKITTRTAHSNFKLGSIEIFDLSGSPGLARLFIHTPSRVSLPELRILRLSHCDITSFPELVFNSKTPNVTELDLSHNPLECTCFGVSWIQNYVRDGRLKLSKEEDTLCATPSHFKDIPLLTATLCPLSSPESVTNLTTKPAGITTITVPDAVTNYKTVPAHKTTTSIPDSVTNHTDPTPCTTTNSSTTKANTSLKTEITLLTTTLNQESSVTTLPPTSVPRTNFTISVFKTTTETDISSLQRSRPGENDSSNTEEPPTLTVSGAKALNAVPVVVMTIILVIIIVIGIAVHCRKRRSANITRQRSGRARNIISMSELSKSQEQLLT